MKQLAERDRQIEALLAREGVFMDEIGELRSLVDAQQDELLAVTEARRHVQGLCDELRQENERLRAVLRDATPEPEPEPPVARPMDLVNVSSRQ